MKQIPSLLVHFDTLREGSFIAALRIYQNVLYKTEESAFETEQQITL